jgi:hypothetical protein
MQLANCRAITKMTPRKWTNAFIHPQGKLLLFLVQLNAYVIRIGGILTCFSSLCRVDSGPLAWQGRDLGLWCCDWFSFLKFCVLLLLRRVTWLLAKCRRNDTKIGTRKAICSLWWSCVFHPSYKIVCSTCRREPNLLVPSSWVCWPARLEWRGSWTFALVVSFSDGVLLEN